MKWIDELRRLLQRAQRQGATPAPPPDGREGGISCLEAAEHLYEWLDAELDPDMTTRVGIHLETCARCYPFLVFERSFREAVTRAAEQEGAPKDLKARILKSLEAEGLEEA